MNHSRHNAAAPSFMGALGAGLAWRMLLIWLLLMLIPVAIATWPVSAALGAVLDHSAYSQAWAETFNGLAMGDAFVHLGKNMAALGAAGTAATLVTLLLAPFLTGMAVSAARSGPRQGFGELMHGGLHEYWRMVRVLLWSLTGWVVAFGIGGAAMKLAGKHAENAILQSDADLWKHLAVILTGILLVLAHAATESARAQFAADPALGSAMRAWGRGLKAVFTRPIATLGVYLVIGIIGFVLVLIFGMLRMRTPAVGVGGGILAFVLAQLVVLSLAWMRIARIHALAGVARIRGRQPRYANADVMPSAGYAP